MKDLRHSMFGLQSTKSKASLSTLVADGKWEKVKKRLRAYKVDEILLSDVKCCSTCSERQSLLHFACRFRPPLSVVQEIIRVHPESISKRDCLGRYAIHIAARHGIDPACLSYMIDCNKSAVSEVDLDGRTPLHSAFINYSWRSQPGIEFGDATRESIASITRMLYWINPKALLLEDNLGKNVLEIAIEEELDFRLLRELQRASKIVQESGPSKLNESLRPKLEDYRCHSERKRNLRHSLPSIMSGNSSISGSNRNLQSSFHSIKPIFMSVKTNFSRAA